MMKTVRVNASKSYDVIVSAGILDHAGDYVRSAAGGGVAAVVTDNIVSGLYLERLMKTLRKTGYKTVAFTFRNGEASKNADNYVKLLNFLTEKGVTRSDVVVALGGGVAGDLAGFAAATYMRGVPFVQIPTTLLAAVDSSVGGKTGINLDAGKNLAGVFYQPSIVLCDYTLLDTLPPRVFADGCAEVIKYGMICDKELYQMLGGPPYARIEEIIARCISIKSKIVCADEFEAGQRKLLNFGHTAGHAIERLSDFRISHGEAVAIGMAVITQAAANTGICDISCYDSLVEILKANDLPYSSPFDAGKLSIAALSDKKLSGDTLTLVVPESIGRCVTYDIKVTELEQLLRCI